MWWVYFDQFDAAAIDRVIEGRRVLRSFLYGYGHLLLYACIVGAGVAVEMSAEEAAGGGEAVPLLGLALAGLLGAFFLTSAGIGRTATPALASAKVALAALGIGVTIGGVPPAASVAIIAAGWASLVALEQVLARAPEPAEPLSAAARPRRRSLRGSVPGGMPRDELNDAVVLLDAAIKHANRWPPKRSAGWNPEQRQQASDAMERAIGLMQQAAEDLRSTHPGGMWRTFDGDLERPYLDRAVGLTLEALGRTGTGGKTA